MRHDWVLSGKWSRRQFARVGTLSCLGLGMADLLRVQARSDARATADACIVLFLNGGPSHLDMWDMKPDAPAEIRGEFKPIASTIPGVPVCEHLPRLSQWMHECTLIRSAHHSAVNAHAAAVYTSLTGHDRGDANTIIGSGPEDYPSLGSVMSKLRPSGNGTVSSVTLPYITKEGRGGPPQPGFFGGWLGRAADPFFVLRDPNEQNFTIPELSLPHGVSEQRLHGRSELLRAFDEVSLVPNNSATAEAEPFRQRAFDLLRSAQTRQAFELAREPLAVREAYGRNIYGQSVLLARRLVEAGTRVVTISWAPDANATWDTHGDNFNKLRNTLLPQLDSALSSLLMDLKQRGMLQRTLVVVMGEFGRSPRINAGAGRDHWNLCYSLLLAGGGIARGTVYGASDRAGAQPVEKPVMPADIIATVYQCLGVAPETVLRDRLSRPFELVPWGTPIDGILA